VGAKRSFLLAGASAALAVAGVTAGSAALSACNPAKDEPARMGEPLMGTPPVDDIAIPSERPLMGKIAPPNAGE
jgi:hypothetical protein